MTLRGWRSICSSVLMLGLLLVPLVGRAEAVTVPIAVDEASNAGIAQSTQTWSAALGDYNNDGWTDFLLSATARAPASCG